MQKLKEQLRSIEDDLVRLEARTAGAALAEVRELKKKKDEFDREFEEVEKAGDEVWESMIEGLKVRAAELKESFERSFGRRKQ